jgi:nickel transport protein
MKSLVRWSATLGLVGSTLLGSFFTNNLSALALPDEQVVQKLRAIPVYTVTDAQGAPLVASVPNGQNNQTSSVAGVFISRKDAQAFVERLKTEKPDIGKAVQVVPVSLAEVYKLNKENRSKPGGLEFAFVPAQQQVQSAQALMAQSGQQQPFNGTPVFVARGGADQGYLTVQEKNQQIIPFFFEKEQLQVMVERFKQQQPQLASTIKIQAIPLEGVIQTLQTKNDPQLNNIVLVPSKESIDFLRSLQSAPAAPTAPAAPAAPQRK